MHNIIRNQVMLDLEPMCIQYTYNTPQDCVAYYIWRKASRLHPNPETVVVCVHLFVYSCENKYVCIHILNEVLLY